MSAVRPILVIEDDDGHARLCEKMIRRAGIANPIVRFAEGGTAFASLCGPQRRHRDAILILLDLNLPDMSGATVLARFKADPELRRCPVMILTTTDDRLEIQRCYDLGCNVSLTKPLLQASFAEAIARLGLDFSIGHLSEATRP